MSELYNGRPAPMVCGPYWRDHDERFEEGVMVKLPFDLTHDDLSKSYGIEYTKVTFFLREKTSKRTIQFKYYRSDYKDVWDTRNKKPFSELHGVDVGYHDTKPHYEGQKPIDGCFVVDGDCYYDGSGLQAEEWLDAFQYDNFNSLWERMKAKWHSTFEDEVDE